MPVPMVKLTADEQVPLLGQGTWHMGERRDLRDAEADALRFGMDLGLTLIDTAEMYADGGAEKVVGQALRGRRDKAFVVSKVYPYNADRNGAISACERSLQRLGTDFIDLYLLHWPGSVPLSETIEAFLALKKDGKIRHFGISNFDTGAFEAWCAEPGGGETIVNQILYNPSRREAEWALLDACHGHNVTPMAYSPLEQGRLQDDRVLRSVGEKHGVTPLQVALAWVVRSGNVIAIPKAASREHVQANVNALDIVLDAADLAAIDDAFPPPQRSMPLPML